MAIYTMQKAFQWLKAMPSVQRALGCTRPYTLLLPERPTQAAGYVQAEFAISALISYTCENPVVQVHGKVAD